MIIKEINQELINIVSKENVRQYEPMKKHTTFNIGGMADIYVLADTKEGNKNIHNKIIIILNFFILNFIYYYAPKII